MSAMHRISAVIAAGALAASGFAVSIASPAQADDSVFDRAQVWSRPGTDTIMIQMGGTCRYVVNAKSGLNVRKRPGGRKVGALPYGKVVFAKKCKKPYGWVKLRGNVKRKYLKKWVYRPYLSRY